MHPPQEYSAISYERAFMEAINWEPEKEDDLYTPNNECSAKKWLEIKQDSQVMLIKNLNRSLVRCKTFAFL
nr:3570_t:CDS:2 [Entrophospora candida]